MENSAYAGGIIYACLRSITHACQALGLGANGESARLLADHGVTFGLRDKFSTRLVTFQAVKAHLPRDKTLCASPRLGSRSLPPSRQSSLNVTINTENVRPLRVYLLVERLEIASSCSIITYALIKVTCIQIPSSDLPKTTSFLSLDLLRIG